MAQQQQDLRPVMLLARLDAKALTLQEERKQIVADVLNRIEQNELDRALCSLFLCKFVGPYTTAKLRELGWADGQGGLTMAGRARLFVLWNETNLAKETEKNLFRQDGQD